MVAPSRPASTDGRPRQTLSLPELNSASLLPCPSCPNMAVQQADEGEEEEVEPEAETGQLVRPNCAEEICGWCEQASCLALPQKKETSKRTAKSNKKIKVSIGRLVMCLSHDHSLVT